MQADLDKERAAIMKHWAKRQEQIERVIGATAGMYGDLQGLAGASIQEIEGFDLKALSFDGSSDAVSADLAERPAIGKPVCGQV